MARKHNDPQTDPQTDQPQNGATAMPYVLQPNRWAKVSSKIYTMKLETDQDPDFPVPKERLVDETDPKNPKYRFQISVGIPMINSAAITDRDSLLAELSAFIDNLAAYDAADGLSNDAIKKPDSPTKVIPRRISLCVNGKGEAISPVEYVRRLLLDANTLSVQKQLQKPLRADAEDVLMAEMGLNPPVGKVRKTKEPVTPADSADAFDSL